MDTRFYRVDSGILEFLNDLLDPAFTGTLSHAWFETNALAASRVFSEVASSEERACYLTRLENRQLADGSWREDPRLLYLPDAMVSTTSALLALLVNAWVTPDSTTVQKGAAFIARNLGEVLQMEDEKKPIGFEPILIDQLNRLALLAPDLALDRYLLGAANRKVRGKLATKLDHLHQTHITLHSVLDAFMGQRDMVDWPTLASFQEADGSMGVYPSSTVALLSHIDPDSATYQRGVRYLQRALRPGLELPPFFASDAFEVWWALYHLADSPLNEIVKVKLLETPHLLTPVPETGLAVTESFSLPDVDTTAMKLAALLFMEQDVSTQSLDAFYTAAGNFQCYQFENRISPSANVHALMVLVLKAEQTGSLTARSQTQFVAGLEYLLAELVDTDHLVDKWNLSDIYATCHAIELFIHIGESFVLEKIPRTARYLMYAKTLEMLQYILTQLAPDGGWGDAGFSTLEETAYAVRAMAKAHLAGIIDIRPLIEGARLYLNYHQSTEDIPLWIGKSLYKSQVITRALQLSALAWLDYIDTQRTANNAHTSSSNHSRPQHFGGV